MKCPQCSSDVGDDSKFCKECGTNISSVKEAHPAFTKTLETPVPQFVKGTSLVDRHEIIEELGKGGMGDQCNKEVGILFYSARQICSHRFSLSFLIVQN